MIKSRRSLSGAEALFGAAFVYAFTGVMVREMSPMWGDKAQVAARYLPVFFFLLGLRFITKSKAKIPQNQYFNSFGFAIAFALVVLFFTASIQNTTLANCLFVFYASNMVTSFLLGTVLLNEQISKNRMIALFFALAGLSLYSKSVLSIDIGIILAICAGILGGISNIFAKLLKGVDRNSVILVQYGIGSVFTWLITLISGEQIIRHSSWRGVGLTLLFAVILVIGANLLLYGLQHFDVNIGTVILSTELIFGALLGWILFQEVPATNEFLGGLLIFSGSVIGALDYKNDSAKKSQASSIVTD